MTTSKRNSIKLNGTQLMLLSAASQRRDHVMIRPETISRRAFTRAVNALLKNDLIANGDHTDAVDFHSKSPTLAITAAGLTAIGVRPELEPTPKEFGQGERKRGPKASASDMASGIAGTRLGTKRAQIIALLSREDGARLDDLIAATGWLPHTTRAALTGLRHNGYHLGRTKGENGGPVYRILSRSADSAPAASRSGSA